MARALLYILLVFLVGLTLASPDCAGVEGGSSQIDRCGVCDGDNACLDPAGIACADAEKDCAGYCGNLHIVDRCGVCDGRDTLLDAAGECCEPSVRDCAGFCTHQASLDACGDCNGNNTRMDTNGACCETSQRGCDGLCFGATPDRCGVCGGADENLDIDGVCCPVAVRHCDGRCGGSAEIDACGICDGRNATMDGMGRCCDPTERGCDDMCGGKTFDVCGACGGDNSPCCRPKPIEACTEEHTCTMIYEDECSGHGVCTSGIGGCVCIPGWTGPHCNVVQDLCSSLDCGNHGACQSDGGLAECFCDRGWVGQFCQFKTCSGRGVYNLSSEECVCYQPFAKATDCETCKEPEAGFSYVCVHTPYMTRAVLLPSVLLNEVSGVVKATFEGLSAIISFPNEEYEGVIYDCGCKPVVADGSATGTVARYSIADADAAMNSIFVSHVDFMTQSSSELAAIRDSTDRAINRSIYYPPVFFMGMGLLIVAMVAALLAAIAFVVPSRIGGLIARYGARIAAKVKKVDPEN